MIALDGMPGAGKTTLLNNLRRRQPNTTVIFGEAQPPDGPLPEAHNTAYLLTEALSRIRTARRLKRTHPCLTVASDRCHIGVLAYRYARMRTGAAPADDFHHALALTHRLGLTAPSAHDHILVLTCTPAQSLHRRRAHSDNPHYRTWFDPHFLDHYHSFLTHLSTWIPATTFTLHDTTHHSAWPDLLNALPSQPTPAPEHP
ncbi:nucleoside/nucleotide kinase family protein [Streptomyces sp. SGAir0957]